MDVRDQQGRAVGPARSEVIRWPSLMAGRNGNRGEDQRDGSCEGTAPDGMWGKPRKGGGITLAGRRQYFGLCLD